MLFVISCQNYNSYEGFELDNQQYTAYPVEREILLSEGCQVRVLGVERDYVIKNENMPLYNGKQVTIIHLFN